MSDPDTRAAYDYCIRMARAHYENFPVASRFVPKHLRDPIAAIYAFARTADDFADEGGLDDTERLAKLDDFVGKLDTLKTGSAVNDPIFIAIADAAHRFQLPLQYFYDLLIAFRMDVTKKRYADHNEVLEYCRYSANPIGRLLLHLYDRANQTNLACSDAICSALQITNFLQDIEQDFRENGRIYLPQDEMFACGVTEDQIRGRITDNALRKLIRKQVAHTIELMLQGAPLGRILHGRPGLELRMTINGGLCILKKISQQHDDLFTRPRLSKYDFFLMLYKSIFIREPLPEHIYNKSTT